MLNSHLVRFYLADYAVNSPLLHSMKDQDTFARIQAERALTELRNEIWEPEVVADDLASRQDMNKEEIDVNKIVELGDKCFAL